MEVHKLLFRRPRQVALSPHKERYLPTLADLQIFRICCFVDYILNGSFPL